MGSNFFHASPRVFSTNRAYGVASFLDVDSRKFLRLGLVEEMFAGYFSPYTELKMEK
jgi:hypothetical protein